MQNATALLQRVRTDLALRAQLQAVGWHSSTAVSIAQAAGFAVTAAELAAASRVLDGPQSTRTLQELVGESNTILPHQEDAGFSLAPSAQAAVTIASIALDKRYYRPGDPMDITVSVQNTDAAAATVTLKVAIVTDIDTATPLFSGLITVNAHTTLTQPV